VPAQLYLHPQYHFDAQPVLYQQVPAGPFAQYQLQNYNATQPLPYNVTGLNTYGLQLNEAVHGYGTILSGNTDYIQDALLYDGSRETSVLSSAFTSPTAQIWSPILSENEFTISPSDTEYATFTTSPVSAQQEVDFRIDIPFEHITNAGQYTQMAPYEPPTISAMFTSAFPSSPLSTISTMSTISHHDSNWTVPAVPSSSHKAEKTSATSGRSTIAKTERQPRKSTAVGPAFRVHKTTKAVVRKEPKNWELAVVELHEKGWKYEEIQKMIEDQYGEKKALSTLRGTKRNIVVPKELRPRSPKWEDVHVS